MASCVMDYEMEDGVVRPLAPYDHSLSGQLSIKVSMMRCQRGESKEMKDSMCDLWHTAEVLFIC